MVSNGIMATPDTLPTATTNIAGQTITANLCLYPLVSRYTGHGDPTSPPATSVSDPPPR